MANPYHGPDGKFTSRDKAGAAYDAAILKAIKSGDEDQAFELEATKREMLSNGDKHSEKPQYISVEHALVADGDPYLTIFAKHGYEFGFEYEDSNIHGSPEEIKEALRNGLNTSIALESRCYNSQGDSIPLVSHDTIFDAIYNDDSNVRTPEMLRDLGVDGELVAESQRGRAYGIAEKLPELSKFDKTTGVLTVYRVVTNPDAGLSPDDVKALNKLEAYKEGINSGRVKVVQKIIMPTLSDGTTNTEPSESKAKAVKAQWAKSLKQQNMGHVEVHYGSFDVGKEIGTWSASPSLEEAARQTVTAKGFALGMKKIQRKYDTHLTHGYSFPNTATIKKQFAQARQINTTV